MPSKWEIVKEESAARIINAAISEFGEKGYTGTTIKTIALKAEVANGLVSKYYQSKENLLLSLFREISLDSIFKGLEKDDPRSVFNHYIEYARKILKENPPLFYFFAMIVSSTDVPESIITFWKSDFSKSVIKTAICQAQEEGTLPKGNPWGFFYLLYSLTYILLRHYKHLGLEPPENDAILSVIRYRLE